MKGLEMGSSEVREGSSGSTFILYVPAGSDALEFALETADALSTRGQLRPSIVVTTDSDPDAEWGSLVLEELVLDRIEDSGSATILRLDLTPLVRDNDAGAPTDEDGRTLRVDLFSFGHSTTGSLHHRAMHFLAGESWRVGPSASEEARDSIGRRKREPDVTCWALDNEISTRAVQAVLLSDLIQGSELVSQASRCAVAAHRGQVDKQQRGYAAAHLAPIAAGCSLFGPVAEAVGWLHDIIEDTSETSESLLERGFPCDVVEAVDSVTKRDGEPYEDLVMRAAQHPVGRFVKLVDNAWNIISSAGLSDQDLMIDLLTKKYLPARERLLAACGLTVSGAMKVTRVFVTEFPHLLSGNYSMHWAEGAVLSERTRLEAFPRFFYDDVVLVCSTEADANEWILQIQGKAGGTWELVQPKILDGHTNVSSSCLDHWPGLLRNDPDAVERTFSPFRHGTPEPPFVVSWDISDWYFASDPPVARIRITDSFGTAFSSSPMWVP
jgi:hypothetical protein